MRSAMKFEIDVDALKSAHLCEDGSLSKVYSDIDGVLGEVGFERVYEVLYVGQEGSGVLNCVLATQKLNKDLPWFAASVKNVHIYRVEEIDELRLSV